MLRGKKILITSGPTRMPLDAIRFISNISTGYFGTLLAKEALRAGARVTFIYGRGSLTPPPNRRLRSLPVETNHDCAEILKYHLTQFHYDALIQAMALLDFQPAAIRKGKTKTKKGSWLVKLVPTEKIILKIKKWDPKVFLVGFKLEVGVSQKRLLAAARGLLKQSKADLVLANQLNQGRDRKHRGFLLNKTGRVIAKALGKKRLAKLILDTLGGVYI